MTNKYIYCLKSNSNFIKIFLRLPK